MELHQRAGEDCSMCIYMTMYPLNKSAAWRAVYDRGQRDVGVPDTPVRAAWSADHSRLCFDLAGQAPPHPDCAGIGDRG